MIITEYITKKQLSPHAIMINFYAAVSYYQTDTIIKPITKKKKSNVSN